MPQAHNATRRVFITGVFDMNNFGDLLFPLVAAHRLAPHGIEVVPVAPTTARPTLADAMPAIEIGEMLCGDMAADAVLIGGGYIVHHQRMDFLKEYRGEFAHWAASGLWLGATLAGALRDIPVVWNAPGVLHVFTAEQRRRMAPALRTADYLSVRDRGSLTLLSPPEDVPAAVVPDTIAELARLWPLSSLGDAYGALMARKGFAADTPCLAFHVRNRSAANRPLGEIAASLDAFAAARGLTPVLVAIGQSHDDAELVRELSGHLRSPHVCLDDPASLREIAAAIAHARLFVGASLHGYIASAAYDVPGVLVARPSYRKFGGFLEHSGRPQDLVRDWSDAFDAAARRLDEPHQRRLPDRLLGDLDRHWQAVATAIAKPAARRTARAKFLRHHVATGVAADGAGWLLDPFLIRGGRSTARHG